MEDFKYIIYFQTLQGKGIPVEDIKETLRNHQFICPQCLKKYSPKYHSKEEAFKTSNLEAREQWLSHICSNECWKNLMR